MMISPISKYNKSAPEVAIKPSWKVGTRSKLTSNASTYNITKTMTGQQYIFFSNDKKITLYLYFTKI